MSECVNNKDFKHHHRGKSSEKLLDKNEIISSLNISEGQTILDAGCGNGYMAKEFAKLVKDTGKVYALDPDKISIEFLQSTIETTTIEPFVGDITNKTMLKGASIDLIYLSVVFHGFSEIQIEGFLAEVQRLLKSDGILAILEIKKEKTPFGPPLNIRLSPEELKEKIQLTPKETINIGRYFYMQLFQKSNMGFCSN